MLVKSYTNSDHFLIQLLKNTEYGSIGSSFIKNKYDEYGLHAIPIESCEDSISFGYIKRARSEISDIAEDFIEYLKEESAFMKEVD